MRPSHFSAERAEVAGKKKGMLQFLTLLGPGKEKKKRRSPKPPKGKGKWKGKGTRVIVPSHHPAMSEIKVLLPSQLEEKRNGSPTAKKKGGQIPPR